jgi:hypothetical protein
VFGTVPKSFDAGGVHRLAVATGVQDTDLVMLSQVREAVAATGNYVFTANPVANDTITINGVVYTFIVGVSAGTNVQIGAGAAGGDTNLGKTIFNLKTVLNASANVLVSIATYADNHTAANKDADTLTITHDTAGAAGNAFPLGTHTSNIARSAATLSGGANEYYESRSMELADLATTIDGILNP